MYAIAKIAGRQYRLSPEAVIKIPDLAAPAGSELIVDEVLIVGDDGKIEVGTPTLPYRVNMEVIEEGREKKVLSYRFVRRGGMRRLTGFKRPYRLVKVKSIERQA